MSKGLPPEEGPNYANRIVQQNWELIIPFKTEELKW